MTQDFEVTENFECFGAEGLAGVPWLVAMGEHSDATLGNLADQIVGDGDLAPGVYLVTLKITATRL